jgi:hypothetical protein
MRPSLAPTKDALVIVIAFTGALLYQALIWMAQRFTDRQTSSGQFSKVAGSAL